jgi:hypothetical protein
MPFYHPFGGRDSTKADKTTPATNHNLAGLTTAGNLEDSTITPATAASQFTLVGGTGTPRTLTVDGDLTASTVNTAVGKAHTRSHSITSTSDHTSTATASQMLKADANGLPVDATNTDAEVSGAVSASHAQNTDTGTTSTTFQVDSGNSGPILGNSDGRLLVGDEIVQTVRENDIGQPGGLGFGVGICPKTETELAAYGISPMDGTFIKGHDNYGNYMTDSGSQIVWVPKFYMRMNHKENPTFAKAAYVVAITGISQAANGVMTIASHGIPSDVTSARILVRGVSGMTDVNEQIFECSYDGADTVKLNVDTSGYDAYTEGGYAFVYRDDIDIKGIHDFDSRAAANAEGYELHRAFIDGGEVKDGFFRFKYHASKAAWGTGYVAASVKNGNPISASSAHNPISDLTACSENYYYETLNAAKAVDGENGEVNANSNWFEMSVFIADALAKIALAHGQAANGVQNCAWWDVTDNFPKGCNDNALKDTDDSTVVYQSDGYSNCGKTGSGSLFAKTTHNGQNCGIADVNGNMWAIAIGMTCEASSHAIEAWSQADPGEITITGHGLTTGDFVMLKDITQADWAGANDKIWQVTVTGDNTFTIDFNSSGFGTGYDAETDAGTVTIGKFYLAKEATAMKDFTSGATLATDHWGATGVAAMMDEIDMPFKSGAGFGLRCGNGNAQVFADGIVAANHAKACASLPKSGDGLSSGGTDLFGKDYFYQYIRNQLCVLCGGFWSIGTFAGVWHRHLGGSRPHSGYNVGCAPACYLD